MHICITLWTLHYTTASALHYGLCITLWFLCYITIATWHYNSCTTLWSPHYTIEMCITTIVTGIAARDDTREFSTSRGNFAPKRRQLYALQALGQISYIRYSSFRIVTLAHYHFPCSVQPQPLLAWCWSTIVPDHFPNCCKPWYYIWNTLHILHIPT